MVGDVIQSSYKVASGLFVLALLGYVQYTSVVVGNDFERVAASMREDASPSALTHQSGSRRSRPSVRDDAAPWLAVGVTEASARKAVSDLAKAFIPSQPCSRDMMLDARRELEDLKGSLSPQARYRLWLHLQAIDEYESRNAQFLRAQSRGNRRGGADPIDCERTLVALAIARRS